MDVPLCIILQHGGRWENIPELTYVGGSIKLVTDVPVHFDASYFKAVIASLGYNDVIKLHYCDPLKPLGDGLRFLGYEDTMFAKFVSLLYECKMIDVFTEHDNDGYAVSAAVPTGNCVGGSVQPVHVDVSTANKEIGSSVTNANVVTEEVDFDEEGSDNEDDEVKEARFLFKADKMAVAAYTNEEESLDRLAQRKGKTLDDDEDDYEDDSSDLDSPSESEDDDFGYLLPSSTTKRRPRKTSTSGSFLLGRNQMHCPFFLGQQFEDAKEFRTAVTNYSVSIGRDLQYTTNKSHKLGLRCKQPNCPFYIWISQESGKKTLSVKTLKANHNCGRVAQVKKLRASWIASTYHNKFKVNPYLKCQEIVDTIWSEWGVKATLWLALKARRAAQRLILGEYAEQYGLLYRYAEEIKKSNPNNTIKIKLDNGVFERLYICFDAVRKGFLAGCRPFFGIDGCFLKGPFGGQLLVAVGRDGNNQMFPIAWACVEVENTETWGWFLQLLADDLDTHDGFGYTIMSDQQKGLLKAISIAWPKAETRVCARHVYCNFRQVFGGGLLYRRGFWKIAKSTTEADWKRNMELFATISLPAAKDLLNRNYKKWVRAFLKTTSSCDSIDNNMNEVFNAYILQSRHKPIITMLEDIREGLMGRMHKKRDFIANKDITICPRIQSKLEKSKLDARGWSAFWDGHFCYGVREGATQVRYVVSLLEKTCSCFAWQLSGVPCNHAVAAIWKAQEHPEHYVSNYFTKNTYLKAYAFPLEPLNGPQEWPESSKVPIQAPPFKKLQNRPTTKRKPSLGEVEAIKLSKKGRRQTHKCSNCREQGHNKTKCPYPPQNATTNKPPTQPRQRKEPVTTPNPAATQQSQNSIPIHNVGVEVYQFQTGFQGQQFVPSQSSNGSNTFHSTQMSSLYNGPTRMF